MSGPANSRAYRRQVLKELIASLHDGKSPEQVRKRFAETFQSVSAQEISEAEQALIADGMPVSEVQRLCDVHASVFKGGIEALHAPGVTGTGNAVPSEQASGAHIPEHPIETFRRENRALEALMEQTIRPLLDRLKANGSPDRTPRAETVAALQAALASLAQVHLHYQRKENLIFPLLEKHGITAPPKVMWGVDDEIRDRIKRARAGLAGEEGALAAVLAEEAVAQLGEMIFKEENILFPMCMENLSDDEWQLVAAESAEIGWCLIDPPSDPLSGEPIPHHARAAAAEDSDQDMPFAGEAGGIPGSTGNILLPSGVLKPEELTGILNTLPVDITFVDKDDKVKFFSQNKDRIFARTKAIIGRSVSNCHPPASVHVVEKLLEDLKAGRKDAEAFWIRMGDKYIHIRYFAVRDEQGAYLGTLEVSQDIAPIQAIEGQKRLVE